MKWDNTDLRVGLMVFGALVLGVVSFLWVGQRLGRSTAPLYTDVTDLQGIGKESQIFLKGFNVGRVSDVRPHVSEDGRLMFRLRMDVVWKLDSDAAMPLNTGLRARVVAPALDIGRGSIVLEAPAKPGEPLKPGDVVPSVLAVGTTNRMQLVVDSVGRDLRLVIAQVDKLVQSLDQTVASATTTLKSANTLLASVNKDIPAIMGSVRANLASADSLIRSMHAVAPATVATLDSVQSLLNDSRVAIARATSFLDDNEPQIASTIANLDQASAVLSNLLKEVSRRPIKALTGVKPPDQQADDGLTNGSAAASKARKP